MTDPAPGTSPRPSAASRYLLVLVIGLVLGIIAAVMVLRAWQARQDPYPPALMTVMARQQGALRGALEQNRCALSDTVPRLQALRMLTNDLDAAFPDLRDDQRFQGHASALRATLNDALAGPPDDCQALATLVKSIGEDCQACHQDFK